MKNYRLSEFANRQIKVIGIVYINLSCSLSKGKSGKGLTF